MDGKNMETGKALELVHKMAKFLDFYDTNKSFSITNHVSEKDIRDALDTIEDLIVNNFEEDDCDNGETEKDNYDGKVAIIDGKEYILQLKK
jgi:hypothetical protein